MASSNEKMVIENLSKVPILKGLEMARAIHNEYLRLPSSKKTGSHAWHKAWIEFYKRVETALA